MVIGGRGVYVLLFSLPTSRAVSIGRLGHYDFPAGSYLYVGSAQGPGGLAARLARHARLEKKQHWHIDYLRPVAKLEQVWALVTDERAECRWSTAAQALPSVTIPAPHFGASDCRCRTHLFHYPTRPTVSSFAIAAGTPLSQIRVVEYDGHSA